MSPIRPAHNLPLQLTSFIGREREIAELKRLLGTSRLLTLTGAGGTGKTRLALQVANQVVTDYPDGVFIVNLAPVTDPSLVVPTIAQTLDVKEAAGQPLIETLKAYLQGRETLLLLDNFEQVVEAAPAVVDLLLAAPDLKVLVTSREPLHLQGEQLYPVPSLELPDPKQRESVEELSQKEAVALFVERAKSASPDFELTDANGSAVTQICLRLDGLPLAIELAAARIRVLTPQSMLSRLDSRLTLLTGGAHDMPARQQTLRNTIDWSYSLLSDGEKQLFRRMAVFQGGRSLQALEAVCNHDGSLQIEVLEGVSALVDKNLLQTREGRSAEPRFWMLETIHEYAREKLLESGEEATLAREHALYFMQLAEEAEPHLVGAKQQEWLDRLDTEHDNIRAALRWARESGNAQDTEMGLRIAWAMLRFWIVRGHYSEGRQALEGLASQAALLGCSKEWRARVLNGAGALATRQSDYPSTHRLLEDALALAEELGDKKSIAASLNGLGTLALEQADYSTARSLYEQGLAIRRDLGDKQGTAALFHNLGSVAQLQGDYVAARALHEQSLALSKELGHEEGIASSLNSLGKVAHMQEDHAAARSLDEQSLALQRKLGDKGGIAGSLTRLALVDVKLGAYSTARTLLEQGLAIRRELGDKQGVADSLNNLGYIAYREGDYHAADMLFKETLLIYRELGSKHSIGWCLAGFGAVAVSTGQPSKGARLLGAVEALLESIDAVLDPEDRSICERAVAAARGRLGEEAFETARQEGRAMSMEQAIAYALEAMPESEAVARAQATPKQSHPNELTRREVEVLRLLAEGLTNEQIAERLFLAGNTVRAHLYSVYSKLNVKSRSAATRFAFEHNLV